LREYPAAIDVADEHDRAFRRARESHVGDVARAQIDLRCAARTFDQHQIGVRAKAREALEHGGEKLRLQRLIFSGPRVADHPALDDDLGADLALRFQEDRVHIHGRRRTGGARLQRLGAADLAAVRGHRGVVGHILRLERADAKAAPQEGAAEARDHQRLADIGAGPLKHERPGGQNSIASCARTPAAK
jgi:hypothetical protein